MTIVNLQESQRAAWIAADVQPGDTLKFIWDRLDENGSVTSADPATGARFSAKLPLPERGEILEVSQDIWGTKFRTVSIFEQYDTMWYTANCFELPVNGN